MSRKKSNKEELYQLSPVEIYKLVLEGKKLKNFPRGFWQQPEAKENAIIIIKYLIEDKLKLSDDELKEQLSAKLFMKNRLRGMLSIFNNSPYEAINLAYPGKFKPWEFNVVTNGYWDDKENIINATKWLVEDKLKLSDKELKEQLSAKLFKDNGLNGMLSILNNSPYEAINLAYPGKFKPWEFNTVPNGYWDNKDNIIKATKWLIEEKLKLSDDELREQLSLKLFIDNGLYGLLFSLNNSPYEAINLAYPNKFKPWEFNTVPKGYWEDKRNIIKATKWLIEEKLKLSDDELREQLSTYLFSKNGFKGILNIFNGSPYEIINLAYPNKFQPWEFNNCPVNYWTKETGIQATKWLIEDKLKLSKEELDTINNQVFVDNGLIGMLNTCFNGSSKTAIREYYDKF